MDLHQNREDLEDPQPADLLAVDSELHQNREDLDQLLRQEDLQAAGLDQLLREGGHQAVDLDLLKNREDSEGLQAAD